MGSESDCCECCGEVCEEEGLRLEEGRFGVNDVIFSCEASPEKGVWSSVDVVVEEGGQDAGGRDCWLPCIVLE